jgi:hypothetical protein
MTAATEHSGSGSCGGEKSASIRSNVKMEQISARFIDHGNDEM